MSNRDTPRQTLRRRERLPHVTPPWLESDAVLLLTICTAPRGANQLCDPLVANFIVGAIRHHDERCAWLSHACVLMPDHMHLLVTVPPTTPLQRVVVNLKRYVARERRVRWQQDFFEHRLRANEHFDAKLEYLRMNPVRAGLVDQPDRWPFFYHW
jgi:putative transposase